MIHLTHTVSGPEIGRELANDPEEAIWALEALAADATEFFFSEVADLIAGQTAKDVSAFARRLADAIDNRA